MLIPKDILDFQPWPLLLLHEQVAEVAKNHMQNYGGYYALLTATPDSHPNHCKYFEVVYENRLAGSCRTCHSRYELSGPEPCCLSTRVQGADLVRGQPGLHDAFHQRLAHQVTVLGLQLGRNAQLVAPARLAAVNSLPG